jgi:hypothetical protein
MRHDHRGVAMNQITVAAFLDELQQIKTAEDPGVASRVLHGAGRAAGAGLGAATKLWTAARAGADAAASHLEQGGGTARSLLGGATRLAPYAGVVYAGHKIMHSAPVENWRYKRQLRQMQQGY